MCDSTAVVTEAKYFMHVPRLELGSRMVAQHAPDRQAVPCALGRAEVVTMGEIRVLRNYCRLRNVSSVMFGSAGGGRAWRRFWLSNGV